MLSWILFLTGTILITLLNVLFNSNIYPYYIVLIMSLGFILFEFIINGLIAYITSKLIKRDFYKKDRKIYNISNKELSFYKKIGIKKWKDKIWELGKLNGFSKSSLSNEITIEYLDNFIIENRIGIMDHLISIPFSLIIILLLPYNYIFTIGLPVSIITIIINFMSYATLKYNIPRLEILKKKLLRGNK